MSTPFEIRELHPFTREDIWPLLSGYETQEIYAVEKTETDQRTVIDIRLVGLERPFRDNFYADFSAEEREWYLSLIPKGNCFGAYQHERLIGLAIGEALPEDHLLRVWEFQVLAEFRRMGVGRALMAQMIAAARHAHLPTIMLETQNTNVNAVRFYRSMGFTLDSIDLSPAHYADFGEGGVRQVAFYMKRKVETI